MASLYDNYMFDTKSWADYSDDEELPPIPSSWFSKAVVPPRINIPSNAWLNRNAAHVLYNNFQPLVVKLSAEEKKDVEQEKEIPIAEQFMSCHTEIDWNSLNHYKTHVNSNVRATNFCADFFYGTNKDGVMTPPRTCLNPNCNRIHTTDIGKIRFCLGPLAKSQMCKNDHFCHFFFCNYQHSVDKYIFTCDGEHVYKCDENERATAIENWRTIRHEAYVKEIETGVRDENGKLVK